MQRSAALVVILFVSILWTSTASAQVATGTISGTITDNTGAVLPGVTVVILNQDTGISRTVLTNETGHYSAPTLGVGQYREIIERKWSTASKQHEHKREAVI